MAALGLWLWEGSKPQERQVHWQLEGPGWERFRVMEFQIRSPEGDLLKREERFFAAAPPRDLSLSATLPEGSLQAWVFARETPQSPPQVVQTSLSVGEVGDVQQRLRLPTSP